MIDYLWMFGPHFNKNFLLVAFFVILFISIINPFSRVTIFRVEAYHIEASTASRSCILHVAFLVILASIIDTPPSRQTFIGECNQCKTAVFTFWPFALQVTFRMVCLKKNKNINKIRIILISAAAGWQIIIICHPAAAELQLAAGHQMMSSQNLPKSDEIPPALTHDDRQIKCQILEQL